MTALIDAVNGVGFCLFWCSVWLFFIAIKGSSSTITLSEEDRNLIKKISK